MHYGFRMLIEGTARGEDGVAEIEHQVHIVPRVEFVLGQREAHWAQRRVVGHNNPLQCSCLENPHGQKSLVGWSLGGRKESDMTEHPHTRTESKLNLQCYFRVFFLETNRF